MKANELKLNNWIIYNDDFIQFQVKRIDDGGVGVSNKNEDTWIELDQFSGIPLTDEILYKCGADYVDEYTCIMGIWTFRRSGNQLMFYYDHVVPKSRQITLSYLHQLQNLYYVLTGEELEYKP